MKLNYGLLKQVSFTILQCEVSLFQTNNYWDCLLGWFVGFRWNQLQLAKNGSKCCCSPCGSAYKRGRGKVWKPKTEHYLFLCYQEAWTSSQSNNNTELKLSFPRWPFWWVGGKKWILHSIWYWQKLGFSQWFRFSEPQVKHFWDSWKQTRVLGYESDGFAVFRLLPV